MSRRRALSELPPRPGQRADLELKGKTLQVYLFMLRKGGSSGVREVQRGLGFSSPSVAFHHLEKLKSLGLVTKDETGQYGIINNVDVSVLQAFIRVGGLLLPRMLFYAAFFTTFISLYMLTNMANLNAYALILGLSATVVTWVETARAWFKRPW